MATREAKVPAAAERPNQVRSDDFVEEHTMIARFDANIY